MSASAEAKLPHNATFARLGKKVWFTLEHSQRARGNGDALDEVLTRIKDQNDQIAQMGLSWMGAGKFDDRRSWNEGQWIAFLRTWQINIRALTDNATNEEKKLSKSYELYWTFYAALPNLPEGDIPEGVTMATISEKVEELLAEFEERLGDPLVQCNKCMKCALGKKMMRCSRCQSAFYCDRECQRKDWKQHKKGCKESG